MYYIEIAVFAWVTDTVFSQLLLSKTKASVCIYPKAPKDLFLAADRGQALGEQIQQIQPFLKR